jgi:hypothetical protein
MIGTAEQRMSRNARIYKKCIERAHKAIADVVADAGNAMWFSQDRHIYEALAIGCARLKEHIDDYEDEIKIVERMDG